MNTIHHSWSTLSDAQRKTSIESIQRYFSEEKDETIGVIAAEIALDHFLEHIGPFIYAKGVQDAKTTLQEHIESLEVDLSLLTQN